MSHAATKPARKRHWRRLFVVAVVLGAYPAFVMVATYRHSLASAIVAYTSSPRCVDLITAVMERGGQGNAARAMDAHNNRLGARIGAAADSWTAMQQAVLAAVNEGAIDARSPDQITWLAPDAWQERLY